MVLAYREIRINVALGHLYMQRRPGLNKHYRQISNIRRTLTDNKLVDHSDVVGTSHVGAAPTTSS